MLTSTNGIPLPNLPADLRFDADASDFAADGSGRAAAKPLGVVRPASVDALERLVRWANRTKVPLIPVSSRGGPRRRGDTVSPAPALIVDLSGMNRIIHVDGRDAVAVIEAGVTFAELEVALKPHGLKALRPLLPRASKSVLAAFLEREPITVPGQHWDSADPLAALELVFGNGDRFRTGGAALPGTLEENLERGNRQLLNSGPGQTDFGRVLQGAQGSLGIVARGSVLCNRVAASSVAWFASADTLAPVVKTAYAMLRKRGDGQLFIVNGAQLALMAAPTTHSIAAAQAKLPAWILFIELTASAHFTAEAIAYRRADLEKAAEAAGARLSQQVGDVGAPALALLLDRSTAAPYKDRAGNCHEDVFFLSQLNRVQGHLDAVSSIANLSETAVYLQPAAHGVNAHCEFTFVAPQRAAVSALARRAAERFAASGAFFSRPYDLWADLAFQRDAQVLQLLKQTKSLFDPQGVLQPYSQALGLSSAPTANAQ